MKCEYVVLPSFDVVYVRGMQFHTAFGVYCAEQLINGIWVHEEYSEIVKRCNTAEEAYDFAISNCERILHKIKLEKSRL